MSNIQFTQKAGIFIDPAKWKETKKNVLLDAISVASKYQKQKQCINLVADKIQRYINWGRLGERELNYFGKTLIKLKLSKDDVYQLLRDLIILAKHNNHNSSTTKINWFGFTNKTVAMDYFIEFSVDDLAKYNLRNEDKTRDGIISKANDALICSTIARNLTNNLDAATYYIKSADKYYVAAQKVPQADDVIKKQLMKLQDQQLLNASTKFSNELNKYAVTPHHDIPIKQINEIVSGLSTALMEYEPDPMTFYTIKSDIADVMLKLNAHTKYIKIWSMIFNTLHGLRCDKVIPNEINFQQRDLIKNYGEKLIERITIKTSFKESRARDKYRKQFVQDYMGDKLKKLGQQTFDLLDVLINGYDKKNLTPCESAYIKKLEDILNPLINRMLFTKSLDDSFIEKLLDEIDKYYRIDCGVGVGGLDSVGESTENEAIKASFLYSVYYIYVQLRSENLILAEQLWKIYVESTGELEWSIDFNVPKWEVTGNFGKNGSLAPDISIKYKVREATIYTIYHQYISQDFTIELDELSKELFLHKTTESLKKYLLKICNNMNLFNNAEITNFFVNNWHNAHKKILGNGFTESQKKLFHLVRSKLVGHIKRLQELFVDINESSFLGIVISEEDRKIKVSHDLIDKAIGEVAKKYGLVLNKNGLNEVKEFLKSDLYQWF